ncbi:hypothetical protein DASC09_033020 [Saccharomycopsis crataegensis]|uniref:Uncharacterized protein n=1 Tax=Saccharomycopsis crataegensis TaxID=43959 RepID=A0AAV5QN66_9ASCO|nr:hypothetical protein DASC09_033020 [Saccharomycopsis crataegensis]
MQFSTIAIVALSVLSQHVLAAPAAIPAADADAAMNMEAVKGAFASTGKYIGTGAKAVGNFAKENGKKVGKAGLIGAGILGVGDIVYEAGKHHEKEAQASQSLAISSAVSSATSAYAAGMTTTVSTIVAAATHSS